MQIHTSGILAPERESQLAKSELSSYRQSAREDVFSYLSTKYALFEVAYNNVGDFDTLFQVVIDSIFNKELKYQLGSTYPRDREEIKLHLVRIVAAERRAYAQGYSKSESKDGLWHTTVLDVLQHAERTDEEPMDISAMQSVIT